MAKILLNNSLARLLTGVEIKTEDYIHNHIIDLRKMIKKEFNKKLE